MCHKRYTAVHKQQAVHCSTAHQLDMPPDSDDVVHSKLSFGCGMSDFENNIVVSISCFEMELWSSALHSAVHMPPHLQLENVQH